MTPDLSQIRKRLRFFAFLTGVVFLTSCATQPAGRPQDTAARQSLRRARTIGHSTEERAADYLQAAALTAPALGSGKEATTARETYNAAAAELTILLRDEDGGRFWNQPLTLNTNSKTYHLKLQPAGPGVWAPDYFSSFELSHEVKETLLKKEKDMVQAGVGGSLVGVRKKEPRENFAPPRGISAAVTATLDFKGDNATLALRRPAKQATANVQGSVKPLAADFSAPISFYRPPNNLLLVGMMGALRGSNMMQKTGLYFLQPYDPDRIPVIFVHGLMSTPFTWVKTINGLQADPEIRKRYQFWVFGYPTGNPILYSALRLREELAKVDKEYPNHKPYLMVGHSMGGIITHMQVTDVTRGMWEKQLGDTAKGIFERNKSDSLIVQAMTFRANPRISRVVFVCAPHRGSDMATSNFGKIGISLISLPLTLTKTMKDSITSADLTVLTGSSKRMPNSVTGLKPTNPAFKVVNSATIKVPYHTIFGDRGRKDAPNSSDGVVAYWSSHLDGARSECVVPGPHSACELPETIAELDRIMRVHVGVRALSRPAQPATRGKTALNNQTLANPATEMSPAGNGPVN